MVAFVWWTCAPAHYPLLNCSVAECHYERCKYQRLEVKCLCINSWRDNYRPPDVRGGLSGLIPTKDMVEKWLPVFDLLQFTPSGLLLRLMLWSWWTVLTSFSFCVQYVRERVGVGISVCVCVFGSITLSIDRYSILTVCGFYFSIYPYTVPISMCACVCVTWQASHLTAPPSAVQSLLTVQSLPGQPGSGKTTWNNLRSMSVSKRQESERDYLISFTTCHAIGGSPLRL